LTARSLITLGGLGTIVAVILISVFLIWVIVPLFSGAHVESRPPVGAATAENDASFIASGVDHEQRMGWTLQADGRLVVRRLSDGVQFQNMRLFGDARPTAWAFAPGLPPERPPEDETPETPRYAFGFEDGTLRSGVIRFATTFLTDRVVTDEMRKLRPGGAVRFERGLVVLTPQGQYRYDFLHVEIRDPVRVSEHAIELLDYSLAPGGTAYVFLDAGGKLAISSIQARLNIMTDQFEYDVREKPLNYTAPADRGAATFLGLSGIGNTVFLAWQDGHCLRFDARDSVLAAGGTLDVVERVALLGKDAQRTVARVGFLVGKTTLVVADDRGAVHCWFPTRPKAAYPRDEVVMARGHVLSPEDGSTESVTRLVASPRSRQLAVGYADGGVRLFHVTTEQELLAVGLEKKEPVLGLALSPKEDGLVAWSSSGYQHWDIDVGHPAATYASLFGKVWYEGAVGPAHVWQSEGGSDDFEPKLGVAVLVFGTLKATLYAMLMAAPIALLAAIFTSEFLTPRLRAPIKSVIEIMASLPSVVLGFLAAMVLAPFVENVLITVLVSLVTWPVVVILGARLWQFLPTAVAVRLAGLPRFTAIALTLPLAIVLADTLAPVVERWCFAGDVLQWLNGNRGSAEGGWSFLLAPICLVAVAILLARFAGPWLRSVSTGWSRLQCAGADFGRLLVVLAGGVLLAWGLGEAFAMTIGDARGSIVGKYDPRNAMIVGFVMGFAIVPIIYTLAEDALSSVPSELREGSLGCGATPWQTAWRIVVPTAMSGLFGALMIGLGRAVGETMIVLMAAGNTPIMDWSWTTGFRTLSANIATELPEAVKNGTHYRVLFLTGFVLFCMTFVINTVAEMVRRRFRKRFADL
jgi:phosphate transport system permease protein